jgi:CHAD domain-containing protein
MTTVHAEREAKFEGCGPFDPQSLRRLPAVAQVREASPEELDAVYYDTADLRLLAHGVTLRRRNGGHDAGWHVKLPRQDGRLEVHAPLRAGRGGNVPSELRRRAAAYARGAALVPVAHLRTHRRRHLLLDERGRRLAEVAQDTVDAQTLDHPPQPAAAPASGAATAEAAAHDRGPQAGTRTRITHWSEIEVELEDGGPELLDAVGRHLEGTGWHPSATARKLDRALAEELAAARGNRAPSDRARPDSARPDRARPDRASSDRARPERARPAKALRPGSAGEAVMARLAEQTAALLEADAGTRADVPDALHSLRSAARRLRGLLRGQRRLLDRRRTDPVARELRWLTGLLADARDHEVLAERLPAQARRIRTENPSLRPALKGLAGRLRDQERARHDAAWRQAVATLDSARYFALLDALDGLLADPPLRPKARQPAAKALRETARRDRRRILARYAAAQDAPAGPAREQALHGVRKAARRARHTAETAAPYTGPSARRLRKRAKALQQLLGTHQDAVVARAELLSLSEEAHRAGADTFGHGVLHAEQDSAIRALQRRAPEAVRAATARRISKLR